MYEDNALKQRNVIILSIVCIFIIAPALAIVINYFSPNDNNTPQKNTSPLSINEARDAIIERNLSLRPGQQWNGDIEITSIKQLHKWWYVAVMKIDNLESPILLSKFSNDKIQAITNPGSGLPYYNISGGLGVPYDVIDKFNNMLDEDDV